MGFPQTWTLPLAAKRGCCKKHVSAPGSFLKKHLRTDLDIWRYRIWCLKVIIGE
jgi:hypothetical protein